MKVSKRYLRMAAAVGGTAAAALLFTGVPAGAEPSVEVGGVETVAAQQQQQQSAIDERYENDPELRALLGAPVADEVVDSGVHYRGYERGRLYYTEDAGVHEVHGDILVRYLEGGGHQAFGVPITDERTSADGLGRFNNFSGTTATGGMSAYWHPDLGAHLVWGPIYQHWASAGLTQGVYGYPTTDTLSTPDGGGLFTHFTHINGDGASIYYSADSGAHGVFGLIRQHWAALGWETSYLGYPVSDEYDFEEGRRSDFQGGYILFNEATGETQDFPHPPR